MLPQHRGIDFRRRCRRRPLPQQEEIFTRLRAHRVQSLLPQRRTPSTQVPFENRQGRSDGHMMADERVDQIFGFRSARVHARQSFVAFALTADIRLLVGVKLRVDEKAMLQIIDAKFRRLFVGHGAEMPGHFDAALVGRIDRGLKLGARDVHVRLERSHSAIGPVLHGLPRIVRSGQVRHLEKVALRALEIRPGDIQMRAGKLPASMSAVKARATKLLPAWMPRQP